MNSRPDTWMMLLSKSSLSNKQCRSFKLLAWKAVMALLSSLEQINWCTIVNYFRSASFLDKQFYMSFHTLNTDPMNVAYAQPAGLYQRNNNLSEKSTCDNCMQKVVRGSLLLASLVDTSWMPSNITKWGRTRSLVGLSNVIHVLTLKKHRCYSESIGYSPL